MRSSHLSTELQLYNHTLLFITLHKALHYLECCQKTPSRLPNGPNHNSFLTQPCSGAVGAGGESRRERSTFSDKSKKVVDISTKLSVDVTLPQAFINPLWNTAISYATVIKVNTISPHKAPPSCCVPRACFARDISCQTFRRQCSEVAEQLDCEKRCSHPSEEGVGCRDVVFCICFPFIMGFLLSWPFPHILKTEQTNDSPWTPAPVDDYACLGEKK